MRPRAVPARESSCTKQTYTCVCTFCEKATAIFHSRPIISGSTDNGGGSGGGKKIHIIIIIVIAAGFRLKRSRISNRFFFVPRKPFSILSISNRASNRNLTLSIYYRGMYATAGFFTSSSRGASSESPEGPSSRRTPPRVDARRLKKQKKPTKNVHTVERV